MEQGGVDSTLNRTSSHSSQGQNQSRSLSSTIALHPHHRRENMRWRSINQSIS